MCTVLQDGSVRSLCCDDSLAVCAMGANNSWLVPTAGLAVVCDTGGEMDGSICFCGTAQGYLNLDC